MSSQLGPADAVDPADAALRFVTGRSSGDRLDPALPISVHFHPDRRGIDGRTTLESMIADGRYRSQFETQTRNGGLTAHDGGDRRRWEDAMFGGAYTDASPQQRPIYGSLNHRRRPVGGSIRSGSAHLRLRSEVLGRVTFCYPDSVFDPSAFGTAERMGLTALADTESGDRDRLDDYIEAHVHGGLLLGRDVEAIVLDPCFAGTAIEQTADRSGLAVEWHPGFRLGLDQLAAHADYRGVEVVALGARLAHGDELNARIIGEAVDEGADQQLAKRLWHCVARFGVPT